MLNRSGQIFNLIVLVYLSVILTACGGGGGGGGGDGGDDGGSDNDDSPPVANAGADQSVFENLPVTLTASRGNADEFVWTQTGGPLVALDSDDSRVVHFTAPDVDSLLELEFSL